MELLQLKYFCDAARSENFSATAKKFSVPASNISQSIKRLEDELGILLFTRQANRVILNENGKEFFKSVNQALLLIENATKIIGDQKDEGEINICINANRRIVMQTIEKFKMKYPEIHIKTMLFCDPLSEDFDLIIDCNDKNLDAFDREILLNEGIGVAINKSNPLSVGKLDFKKFSTQPFITMSKKSNLHSITESICNDFGFSPNIAVVSDDPFYVRKCVELGLGVAVVPIFSWQGQYGEDTVLREFEGYSRSTYIYTLKDKYIPLCVKNFIKFLKNECK